MKNLKSWRRRFPRFWTSSKKPFRTRWHRKTLPPKKTKRRADAPLFFYLNLLTFSNKVCIIKKEYYSQKGTAP
nr:MAG TPA: hypothetical protein [Caudoviricetes sp.]